MHLNFTEPPKLIGLNRLSCRTYAKWVQQRLGNDSMTPPSIVSPTFFYAHHALWHGPFTLLPNGIFIGGSYKPNGRWVLSPQSNDLIIRWYSWNEQILHPAADGFQNSELRLQEIGSNDPSYQAHGTFLSQPLPDRAICGISKEGLCDRLTNMLLLNTIAKDTGRSARWCWPLLPTCNCAFHDLFECDSIVVSDDFVPLGPQVCESRERVSHVLESARRYTDEPWIHLPDGYFGHNYEGLDALVRPSEKVQALLQAYKKAHWKDTMVGVHIRRGDRSQHSPVLSRYCNILDRLVDDFPTTGVFLSTDDPHCTVYFTRRYGKRIVHYPVKTFSRDVPEGMLDAVVCLYLLRSTGGCIGSTISGYSICAGWDCGFIDVHSAQSPLNFPWFDEEFSFRPLSLRL
jgi:hypothetical protein